MLAFTSGRSGFHTRILVLTVFAINAPVGDHDILRILGARVVLDPVGESDSSTGLAVLKCSATASFRRARGRGGGGIVAGGPVWERENYGRQKAQ